jgi:hypothetical protein
MDKIEVQSNYFLPAENYPLPGLYEENAGR